MSMPTREERIQGALYGLLIGDALGVPYEFHPPAQIPAPALIELQPPEGFSRAHEGVAPGTWSDDGAHALCLSFEMNHQFRSLYPLRVARIVFYLRGDCQLPARLNTLVQYRP